MDEKKLLIITLGTYYEIPVHEIGLLDIETGAVYMRGGYSMIMNRNHQMTPDIFTHIYWRLESEYKMPILDIIAGKGVGNLYSIKYAQSKTDQHLCILF